MIEFLHCIVAAAIGYLMGSLPIGYVLVYLFRGQDLRQQGSGRTGGTNAMRAAGPIIGIMTAVADIAKGAGTIWIVQALFAGQPHLAWIEIFAGMMAVIGHNWSLFLGFKGGAGTSPNIGVAVALWPTLGLFIIPMGIGVLLLTGYASVASLVVALLIPVGLLFHAALGIGSWIHPLYGVITLAMVVISLLPNIKRLLAGNERMVGPRAKAFRRTQQSEPAP